MITKVKAFLIDPHERAITPIELDKVSGDSCLGSLYLHMGCHTIECPVKLPNEDSLYVDEEGLFREPSELRFFSFWDFPQPIAGKAILAGTNDDGETVDVKTPIHEVIGLIDWLDKKQASAGFDRVEAQHAKAEAEYKKAGITFISGLYRPEGY